MTFVKDAVTVTVNEGIILPANDLPKMVHWQTMTKGGDGSLKVFNRDVTEWYISVVMQVSDSVRSSLRSFVQTTIEFAQNTFTFTPDSGVDVGAGDGASITVNMIDSSWPERVIAPDVFQVGMILRAVSTGTGNPS